jgi:hypothetical protein
MYIQQITQEYLPIPATAPKLHVINPNIHNNEQTYKIIQTLLIHKATNNPPITCQ